MEKARMEKSLKITSVGNARELGGIFADGKTIKHNRLLRTASLAALSLEDCSVLESFYRVASVVDFRMSLERRAAADPEIPGAKHFPLPVLEAEDFPGFNEETAKMLTDPKTDRFALMKNASDLGMLSDRLYVDFLFSARGKAAYRSFFKCLLELPEDCAILWHCTDGKDRTGIASMLLLTALNADRETILSDYMLTNEYNAEKLVAVREGLEHSPFSEEMKELMMFGAGAVYEKYMENALCALEEHYGSPMGYLEQELGVGTSECDELRRKFLE